MLCDSCGRLAGDTSRPEQSSGTVSALQGAAGYLRRPWIAVQMLRSFLALSTECVVICIALITIGLAVEIAVGRLGTKWLANAKQRGTTH
jgi:hypothetical protein